MKKMFTTAVIALCAIVALSTSCSNLNSESETKNSTEANMLSEKLAEYNEIGKIQKEQFCSFLAGNARTVQSEETYESEHEFCNTEYTESADALNFLLENRYVSEEAGAYIVKINSVLFDETKNSSEVASEISLIEEQAFDELLEADATVVLCFAETAKSVDAIFSEYFEGDSAQARLSWKKFKRRIREYKHVIVSATLSAAIGGAVGFATGGPAGAIAGAISCGVAGGKVAYSETKDESERKRQEDIERLKDGK